MRIWASVTGGLIRSSRKYLSATFSPLSFFAAGEQGAWYDPSDFSTLFQDSAGTTPVTAVEQPVGKINDKSGRGNHALQATAAARPVLKQDAGGKYYLLFDGVDDGMATAAINFSATNKMTVWAGAQNNGTAFGGLCELSADFGSNAGSFLLAVPLDVSGALRFYLSGNPATIASTTTQAFTPPKKFVVAISSDLAQATIAAQTPNFRVDGTPVTRNEGGTPTTATAFGSYPIYIGRRGGTTQPFNGHLYSMVIRGAASSAAQVEAGESFVAGKSGVVLP